MSVDPALEPGSGSRPDKPMNPPAENWRALAAAAAGTLLGMPFVGSHTVHAAWAEISRFLSLSGKPEAPPRSDGEPR